jgi:hypothetical protein
MTDEVTVPISMHAPARNQKVYPNIPKAAVVTWEKVQ